jgi:hypothetical protein
VHLWALKIPINYFGGRSRLDATVLIGIISKGATKFELKFFQVHSFLFCSIFKTTYKINKITRTYKNSTL